MSTKEEYTLRAEQEYQIVDAGSRELSPNGEGVLRQAKQTLGEEQ